MDGSAGHTDFVDAAVEEQRPETPWREIAQGMAMAVAIPSVVGLCLFPNGFSAFELVALFGLALLPSLVMTVYVGIRQQPSLSKALVLFCLLSVAGAYVLVIRARHFQITFDDSATACLFFLAQAPAFALLYALLRSPVQDLGKPTLPLFLTGVLSIGLLAILAPLAIIDETSVALSIDDELLCALYGLALTPPLIANVVQARRERKLPVEKKDKQPDHISGVGATALITFVVVIVTLGLWAAASGTTAMIDGMAGLIVIFGLAAAFVVLAVGPIIARISSLQAFGVAIQTFVKPLGAVFSWIDSILVFAIAAVLGASQKGWGRRYTLLVGVVVPSAVLGWWFSPPFGLIPLSFSIVGAIAIARRWAWVEEDRENAMLNRRFEGPHIRVGFGQDLRDETLIAFMALLFLVPLVLRQLYFFVGPDQTFSIDQAIGPHRYDAWLSFFGTELAKALPFVDWAEIYHVHGDAPIKLEQTGLNAGNHIIFATRILVDLVLLAAFLQAISIAQRTSKLKDMFYKDQTIDQLDPFLESAALSRLVTRSEHGFEIVEKEYEVFPRYNEDRLETLKLRGPGDELGFVAGELLDRYSEGGPAEKVVDEAKRVKPDRERLDELIAELHEAYIPGSALRLKAAHFLLNSRPSFWPVRLALTELISRDVAANPNAPPIDAINALSEILIGPGQGVMDVRREVRLAATNGLRPAVLYRNPIATAALRRAMNFDVSTNVKERAREILEDSGS